MPDKEEVSGSSPLRPTHIYAGEAPYSPSSSPLFESSGSGILDEVGASYIPTEFAAGTFLESTDVVPKALFLCVEDLSGKRYAHAQGRWVSRLPTAAETELFGLTPGASVLHVTHTARADDGTVLEVSESVWPAERVFIDEYDVRREAES